MSTKVMFAGIYNGGMCYLVVDSEMYDVEETKATIKDTVRNYLLHFHDVGGWEMPYSYNFGDVLDEIFQHPELQSQLKSAGITVLPNDINVELFDHDEIWIDQDEVNHS